MNQPSELECGNIRVQIEIAKRVDHLKQQLEGETTPASLSIQQGIHKRGTQTEIDVLAGLLGGTDHELSVAAAQWIDHQAQSFYRVGHPGGSTWWLSPLTAARLVASLSSRHPQVRWHLLSAYPVLQFGEPHQVLPALLDRRADHEQQKFPLAALRAIQTLGIDLASGAIGRLSPLTNDPVPEVRSEIYRFLAWLGSEAVETVPLLVNRIVMEDGNPKLRREATLALIACQPSDESLLEAINLENQEAVVQALREAGKDGRSLRRTLTSQQIQSVSTPQTEANSRPDVTGVWFNKAQIATLLNVHPRTVTRMLSDQRLIPLATRPRGRASGHFDYLFRPTTLEDVRRYVIDRR